MRIYIRLTDLNAKCLEGRKVVSRRKHLCKDWFNDEWSKRITGIMRFLGSEGEIEIGEDGKVIDHTHTRYRNQDKDMYGN